MIYDGECHFCCFWVRRWQALTGPRLEYKRSQDPEVAQAFPELSRNRLEQAVHLIEPDGAVYSGAEAVFRSLAAGPTGRGWLAAYRSIPGFASVSEWGYGVIARHRPVFSALTRLTLGPDPEPPRFEKVRWIFL